ncbi:hypothetical protein U0070_006753 [Myodes glareolus]|uniref:Cystatin domain-containing protein n=2 Tax=Myodes glareolus TaxID=447135 RepID=A0AAW0H5D2_MYOGA
MLTTLVVALNLSLSPMLVHTLQNDTEKFSVQEIGAPEALQYAVSKYNENSDDLYRDVVVQVKDIKFQHKAAGTKYLFHVILDQSICKKSQSFFASCPLSDLLQRKYCHFEVYVEQLDNHKSLTSSKCNRIGLFHTAAQPQEDDDAESMLEDPDVGLL